MPGFGTKLCVTVCLVGGLVLASRPAAAQMCTLTSYRCSNTGVSRVCSQMFTRTGSAACTTFGSSPAYLYIASWSQGMASMFTARCIGAAMATGQCSFTNCGVCGSFVIRMTDGLPVELMDFDVEPVARGGDPVPPVASDHASD